jgi:tetratricopeptide (TPR) repeat protein
VHAAGGHGFVGREDAVGRVQRALESAGSGDGPTLVITGSAGIGKTTLLREALRRTSGVILGWGTCIESGGAPGFWPWTQALNGVVRAVGLERSLAAAGRDRGLLANLLPALGEAETVDGSDRTQMLVFDATLAWLRALGSESPIAIAIDDIQWADESSMGLLELVAGDPRAAGICLLGTARHDEIPRHLEARFGTLLRRSDHVRLKGLDRAATGELVDLVTSAGVHRDEVDAIFRRAAGHPFFTRELALAAVDDTGDQIPEAIRDTVHRRLERLPSEVRQVLEIAGLTGTALLPDVIAEVTGTDVHEVDSAVSRAVDAGVLTRGEEGIAFTHDLFRELAVEGVDPVSAPQTHLLIGRALEARCARGAQVSASEIARHFRAALACGGGDRAVYWTLVAAKAEVEVLAFSEAVAHLRRLRAAAVDTRMALRDVQMVEVLLAEADALARMGRGPDARGLIHAARATAERASEPGWIARAALAEAALGARFATRRDDIVRDLESAIAALDGSEPALEARLTAELARALQHSVPEQRERAIPLSERALKLGRETRDPEVLGACLLASHDVLWSPGHALERADVAEELVELARRSNHRELLAQALLLHANALLECGRFAFRPALDECFQVLDDLGHPLHHYTLETRRACLGLMQGDLVEAERAIDRAWKLGARLREPDAENVRMSQTLELIRARGRPNELGEFADIAIEHWSGAPVHAHSVAAGFRARAGDIEGAKRHIAIVDDLGTWRADDSYLRSVFVRELAYAAAAVEDQRLCEELFAEVEPLSGNCGVNGAMVAFAGCYSLTAGRLAAALGYGSKARSLFREATTVYERLSVADPDLEEAIAVLGADRTPKASICRRGRVWEVSFAGRSASVVHSKGMQDIAQILRSPDREIHVLDLMQAAVLPQSSDPMSDRSAIDSYRRRLTDLSLEREAAQASSDEHKLLMIDDEYERLLEEFNRTTGVGTRERAFSNHPTERARKAVTARIRDAIARLADALPELGAHLDRDLTTGVRCRYTGSERWHIEL